MVHSGFPGDQEQFERIIKPVGKGIEIKSPKISSVIKGIAIGTAFLIATPAHSDTVNHGEDSALENREKNQRIKDFLRLENMGIPTDEFMFYMTPDELDYQVAQLSQGNVGPVVGSILLAIEEEIKMRLGGLDIPVITDLVLSKNSGDILLWHQEFHDVLEFYSAFKLELEIILARYGLNPNGEET